MTLGSSKVLLRAQHLSMLASTLSLVAIRSLEDDLGANKQCKLSCLITRAPCLLQSHPLSRAARQGSLMGPVFHRYYTRVEGSGAAIKVKRV